MIKKTTLKGVAFWVAVIFLPGGTLLLIPKLYNLFKRGKDVRSS